MATGRRREKDYLASFESEAVALVLDRKNFPASGAAVMEFRELLQASGAFVRVKRGETNGLSLVTAQPTGSATSWGTEAAIRYAAVDKVDTVCEYDSAWLDIVSGEARQSGQPNVLAIGTDKQDPLSNTLSTLALPHLHRAIHAIQSPGFPGRYCLIPES